MLEGLEISEINFSKLYTIETFRFDSDYFLKKYLKLESIINNKVDCFTSFDTLSIRVDASAFYPSLEPFYNKGDIPFIRVADVNDFVDYENCIKIPDNIIRNENFNTLKTIDKGDIVITKGGSIGRVALIDRYTAVTRDLIFINSSILEKQDYVFLYFYLISNFAQDLVIQSSSMTAQPHLTITLIKDLPIFNASIQLKQQVENLYNKVIQLRQDSQSLYSQAEQLLLEELGLKDWQPSTENTNEKTFKESFLSTGRLDSEYYQTKYEEYLNLVLNYDNGYKKIDMVCQIKDFNYQPDDIKKYKYIELSNIGKTGEINGYSVDFGINLPSRARRQVKTNDVLISSIEGSLSSCALVTKEYDDAICSTGFYVINSKVINSETLLILFKSEVLQNLLKQGCSGTILTAINKDEFLNLPIPIIKSSIQNSISILIQDSFALRKQSEHLLEVAKRVVEIAIEQNEDKAMEYMKENAKF